MLVALLVITNYILSLSPGALLLEHIGGGRLSSPRWSYVPVYLVNECNIKGVLDIILAANMAMLTTKFCTRRFSENLQKFLCETRINFKQGIQNVSDNVGGGNGMITSPTWYLGSENRRQLISRVGVILSHWFRNWTLSSLWYLVPCLRTGRPSSVSFILQKMAKISIFQFFEQNEIRHL